jgi:hypothetical protein
MVRVLSILWALLCTSSIAFAQTRPTEVDVALVLAIDVSNSVSGERWLLQKRGYATAFRDPHIIGRIRSGQHGRIAVAVVLWSSEWQQKNVVGWTIIQDQQGSYEFAEKMEHLERAYRSGTVISSAIKFSVHLLESAPPAKRKVIDVSGDGAQEWSQATSPGKEYTVGEARNYALEHDVTINGLALMLTERDYDFLGFASGENQKTVAEYEAMIGGPGAFLIVVRNPYDFDEFTNAVRKKLYREMISSAGLP